jgi:hypothetical protein
LIPRPRQSSTASLRQRPAEAVEPRALLEDLRA